MKGIGEESEDMDETFPELSNGFDLTLQLDDIVSDMAPQESAPSDASNEDIIQSSTLERQPPVSEDSIYNAYSIQVHYMIGWTFCQSLLSSHDRLLFYP
jgi:hypothetical protein